MTRTAIRNALIGTFTALFVVAGSYTISTVETTETADPAPIIRSVGDTFVEGGAR